MKITVERADGAQGAPAKKLQRHRRSHHQLPLWLMQPMEEQRIAQARCLMVLSVLSGQKSIQEAISEAKVSRVLYYQLEDRALNGMMMALGPRVREAPNEQQELARARVQVRHLTARVKWLVQRRRAAERLLRLMMKSNRTPVKIERRGRPRKALSTATMRGGDLP
jgi:hypothetical protein